MTTNGGGNREITDHRQLSTSLYVKNLVRQTKANAVAVLGRYQDWQFGKETLQLMAVFVASNPSATNSLSCDGTYSQR